MQELREALLDFKTSGKPVYAFLEYGGDREYYLATAADKIFLVPTATLDLTGVATYEVFLRGTLDWIGTYPDLIHIGDYKTAINIFTEKTFTPAHKEMSASLNRDQFDQLVRAIADGRRKTEAEVRAAIDAGPAAAGACAATTDWSTISPTKTSSTIWSATSAARARLRLIESDDYARVTWESLGVPRRSKIAVLNAVGAITGGRGGYDPINGPVLGSDSFVEYIRRVRADSSIRAIVVAHRQPRRVVDRLGRDLARADDHQGAIRGKRPIVVSMSDLAASGGYYIAMAGDVIVAQPGTLTGSIGIYSGKFVTGGSFDKLGANVEATSERPPRRDLLARSTLHRRGARQGAWSRCRRSTTSSSRRSRSAADLAGEDRSDRAGAGVDGPAGQAGRAGRSAGRAAGRGGRRQAARADSRG